MKKPTAQKIGKMIRDNRKRLGMSQSDVAEVFGHATPQFVSFIERGISKPPRDFLKLAQVKLGLDLNKVRNILTKDYAETLDEELGLKSKKRKVK